MGGFGIGLLGGFTDAAQKRLDQRDADERQQKQELRGGLWKIAYDTSGQYNDATKQNARDQLEKLYGPEAKKGLQKFTDIFSRIHKQLPGPQDSQGVGFTENLPNGQPAPGTAGSQPNPLPVPAGVQPQAQPAQQTAQAAPSNIQAQLPIPPPVKASTPSNGGFSLPPVTTQEDILGAHGAQVKQQLEDSQQKYDFWKKKGEDIGLTGRDLALYAGSDGSKLPAQSRTGNAKPEQWELPDGSKVDVDFDPVSRIRYFGGDEWEIPEGAKRVQKTSSARPTIIASDFTTLGDAQKLAAQGIPFNGDDGKPLDLSKIPQGMVLQKVHYADGKTLYQPRNINDKVVTVGNVVYAVNPSEVQTIPQGGGTALGVARTGSSNTPTQVVTDAQGVPHVIGSTTSPNTPGSTSRTTAPKSGAPAATPQGGGTPSTQPSATGGGKQMSGVPVGMYNQMLNRVTPVREAATQVFGDPSQPDMKGLKDYMDLADDPKSRDRLGKALRLTLDGINDATHGGNVAVGAGPVHVSAGGVGEWLQNSLGVPQAVAAQKSKIMQDALKDLTPKEQEAYNAIMSAFSVMVGLRSLTRASAAQGSVAAIERELPVIGVNTVNSSQFADQLQRLAEVVYNGTKGIPAGMLDPALIDRIKNLPGEMQKVKAKNGASPKTKNSLPAPAKAPKNAAEYMQMNGIK